MSRPNRSSAALEQAISAVRAAGGLSSDDLERLRPMGERLEVFTAGALIDPPRRSDRMRLITAGWAYEARLLPDGRRHIFSYLLPGDLISSRHATRSTGTVLVALTRVDTMDVPPWLMTTRDGRQTSLAAGLNLALQHQEQRSYDALVRLGQYSARERVAHLMIELRNQLLRVGLASEASFRSPLTQEHLADTLGLSVIHVNRILRQLRSEGLLTVKFGLVTLLQPERLELMAAAAER